MAASATGATRRVRAADQASGALLRRRWAVDIEEPDLDPPMSALLELVGGRRDNVPVAEALRLPWRGRGLEDAQRSDGEADDETDYDDDDDAEHDAGDDDGGRGFGPTDGTVSNHGLSCRKTALHANMSDLSVAASNCGQCSGVVSGCHVMAGAVGTPMCEGGADGATGESETPPCVSTSTMLYAPPLGFDATAVPAVAARLACAVDKRGRAGVTVHGVVLEDATGNDGKVSRVDQAAAGDGGRDARGSRADSFQRVQQSVASLWPLKEVPYRSCVHANVSIRNISARVGGMCSAAHIHNVASSAVDGHGSRTRLYTVMIPPVPFFRRAAMAVRHCDKVYSPERCERDVRRNLARAGTVVNDATRAPVGALTATSTMCTDVEGMSEAEEVICGWFPTGTVGSEAGFTRGDRLKDVDFRVMLLPIVNPGAADGSGGLLPISITSSKSRRNCWWRRVESVFMFRVYRKAMTWRDRSRLFIQKGLSGFFVSFAGSKALQRQDVIRSTFGCEAR